MKRLVCILMAFIPSATFLPTISIRLYPKQNLTKRIVAFLGLFMFAVFTMVWSEEVRAAEDDFDYLLEDFEGDFVDAPLYGSIPSGWTPKASQNVEFSKGSDAHHGEFCLHAHVTYDPDYYSALERKFFFQAGELLNLRIQVKALVNGERAQMKFSATHEWPPDTWNYHSITRFFYPTSSDWEPITLEHIKVPPDGQLPISLMLHHDTYSGSTDFDLDCFSMSTVGDINADSNVDLRDAVLALQVVCGLNPEGVDQETDLNGDEKIGMEEAIYVLQKISGLR